MAARQSDKLEADGSIPSFSTQERRNGLRTYLINMRKDGSTPSSCTMDEKIYFANEIEDKVGLSTKEIYLLARLMKMPKIGGWYRFTKQHIDKLKEVIGIIKNKGAEAIEIEA